MSAEDYLKPVAIPVKVREAIEERFQNDNQLHLERNFPVQCSKSKCSIGSRMAPRPYMTNFPGGIGYNCFHDNRLQF